MSTEKKYYNTKSRGKKKIKHKGKKVKRENWGGRNKKLAQVNKPGAQFFENGLLTNAILREVNPKKWWGGSSAQAHTYPIKTSILL